MRARAPAAPCRETVITRQGTARSPIASRRGEPQIRPRSSAFTDQNGDAAFAEGAHHSRGSRGSIKNWK